MTLLNNLLLEREKDIVSVDNIQERSKVGEQALLLSPCGHLSSNPTPCPWMFPAAEGRSWWLRTTQNPLMPLELARLDPLRHTLPQKLPGSWGQASRRCRGLCTLRENTWTGEEPRALKDQLSSCLFPRGTLPRHSSSYNPCEDVP